MCPVPSALQRARPIREGRLLLSHPLRSFQRRDIYEELVKSQKVFSEKLNHLSRRLAWINVTIYSKVRGRWRERPWGG